MDSKVSQRARELLACPFCGFDGGYYVGLTRVKIVGGGDLIRCGQCRAQTCAYPTEDAAITAWNTRTPSPDAVLGRVEITSDDPAYKELSLRPRPETIAAIERDAALDAQGLADGRNMIVGTASPDAVREAVGREEARLDAAARALYKAYEDTTDERVARVFDYASETEPMVREAWSETVQEMRDWAAKVLAAADSASALQLADTRMEALEPFAVEKFECALGIAKATEAGECCEHCDAPNTQCFKIGRARAALAKSPPAAVDAGSVNDEAARRYIRDWCPDNVRDYAASLTAPAVPDREGIIEECAQAIDAERELRGAHYDAAKAAGLKKEARDFETMVIAHSQSAAAVRALKPGSQS